MGYNHGWLGVCAHGIGGERDRRPTASDNSTILVAICIIYCFGECCNVNTIGFPGLGSLYIER